MRCDQCEAVMINEMFCHETGCPNAKARYDKKACMWVQQYRCFECGCSADADYLCCAFDDVDPEDILPGIF